MAPKVAVPTKRKKHNQGGQARKKFKRFALKPSLNSLPQEIVDRICDFLRPNHDTLLSLRSVCIDLATKTSEAFGMAYFSSFNVLLSRAGWSMFQEIPKHQNVGSYITSLKLIGPCSLHRVYANFMLAKGWGTGLELAKACSELPSIHTFSMVDFSFKDCRPFMGKFLRGVRMKKLKHLYLFDIHTKGEDLGAFMIRHKKLLHQISLNTINLTGGYDQFAKDLDEKSGMGTVKSSVFCVPWSSVFKTMLKLDEPCLIEIARPMQFGREVHPISPYLEDDWFEEYGLSISRGRDEEMSDLDSLDYEDFHTTITIQRNAECSRSLALLDRMYTYSIHDPQGNGTPPWIPDCDSGFCKCPRCAELHQLRADETSSGEEQAGDDSNIVIDDDHPEDPGQSKESKSTNENSATKQSTPRSKAHGQEGTDVYGSPLCPITPLDDDE